MVRECRGSSSSSAVVLELLHRGLAPTAIVLGTVDAIVGLGILVGTEMGLPPLPLLILPGPAQARFGQGAMATIDATSPIHLSAAEVRAADVGTWDGVVDGGSTRVIMTLRGMRAIPRAPRPGGAWPH